MLEAHSVMSAELAAAKDFLSLLQEEESALVAGDTERLPDIVQSKSEKIRNIARLAQERNQLVPLPEMDAWLKNRPESSKIWQSLMRLSEEIKEHNRVNGAMIDMRLRSTQQALNMLQSLASTTTSLYGPDGQSSISTGGSRIDNA